jgi:predicted ATPase
MADVNAGTNRLVGRDRELATLGSFLGEAVGDGATLLLTGEPGVGKTALLVAAAEMATSDGGRVLRGGGVEYETDVSFAGLHQLVDVLSDDLRLLPRSSRASLEVALTFRGRGATRRCRKQRVRGAGATDQQSITRGMRRSRSPCRSRSGRSST